MAWIELHDTLPSNKKIVRLKRRLKIKTAQAVGHVCLLWLWAVNNAEDGNLRDLDNEDIAEIADWQKNADAFVNALCDVGFLDDEGGELCLHDWANYAGRLLEQREITREQQKARQRKRRQRLRDAALAGTLCEDDASRVSHAPVTGDNGVTVTQNNDAVTRESRVSHAHTIPNHTIPNQTKPNLKRSTSLSDEREVPRESPPDPVQNENRTIAITDPGTFACNDYELWLMRSRGWTKDDVFREREKRGQDRLTPPQKAAGEADG